MENSNRLSGNELTTVTATEDLINPDSLLSGLLDLDDTDRIILQYILEYPGIKMAKIARILGTRENFIRHRVKKPAFRFALQKIQSTTEDLMVTAAKKAAIKLMELIEHPNPMISLGAVKIALARFVNKTQEPTEEEIIKYKTTIESDGSLLQNVILRELGDKIIDI
jgi:hypothetical protein